MSAPAEATGGGRAFARACLIAVVALNLAAFAVRLRFVAVSGALAATTGFEEFCLYNIWKAAHGLPLYEWPQREPYLLTSYNFGFYRLYAAWAHLWRADGAALVTAVRLFTPLWAVAGALLQVHLVRRLVPAAGRRDGWVWGLSFLAWFGTCFTAWTTVSARPDIAAAALALAGLAAAFRVTEARRTAVWIAASLLFFAAWSCKQSVVWVFAGTALHLLVARRWRELAALTVPFAGLALAALGGGGEAYRYNLLAVPRIFHWTLRGSLILLVQALALNLFFWWHGLGALRGALDRHGSDGTAGGRDRWRMTALAGIVAVAMGAVQLSYHGSSTNNILEGFLIVALLATAAWSRAGRREGGARGAVAGAWLLLSMAPVPVAQLVLAARGAAPTAGAQVKVGNLVKLTAEQQRKRQEFAVWLGTLPKPLWIRDAMLQLPWFATDNRYPTYLDDYEFDQDASALIGDGGVGGLVMQRRFACLLLRPDDWLVRRAKRAGYVPVPVPAAFARLPSEYGIDGRGPLLFVRGAGEDRTPDGK